MTFTEGAITSFSRKQKLNTKSSAEAEFVGVDDLLPQFLWTLYFVEGQGYAVEKNEINQDNMIVMILEYHGKGSSSKKTDIYE